MTNKKNSHRHDERDIWDRRLIDWMENDLDAAFGRIAEIYYPHLRSFAFGVLCGSPLVHLMEDVVQEGLLSAYRFLRTHELNHEWFAKLHLRAWLYTITRNKAIKCLVAGEDHLEITIGLLGEESVPNDLLDADQQLTIIRSDDYIDPAYIYERREAQREARKTTRMLLQKLPATDRAIIERVYLPKDGSSPEETRYEQIAGETNKSVGAVKVKVSRARKRMRELYTDMLSTEQPHTLTREA